MKLDFFTSPILIIGILLVILSIWLFMKKCTTWSLLVLFFASLFTGLFMATLDPFLNLWDEQFHALVAKNLIRDPFKPLLIAEPVVPLPGYIWTNSHLWLHKQPLFLWQIALSLKLFGISELAVRIPSVLLHALSSIIIYRLGKLFFSDKIGFYSAVFYTCAYFPLEFVSGFYPTDHNDTAFAFYTIASIWAFCEYLESRKKYLIILVGLFCGAAVLCKWLPGLLIYGPWFFVLINSRQQISFKKELLAFFVSFCVAVLIFIPWQIFASSMYPIEYKLSMLFNMRHLSEALEGHGGDYLFYYNSLHEQFGEGAIIPIILLICLILMIRSIKKADYRIVVTSCLLLTYTFFSFVSTKMYGYVLGMLPFFYIALAFCTDQLLEKLTIHKKISASVQFVLVLAISFFLFDHEKIYKHHSAKEPGRGVAREIKSDEKNMYTALKRNFKDKKCLIFNLQITHENQIPAIFYTGFPAVTKLLSEEEITRMKRLKYKLIAYNNGKLPENIIQDPEILKISLSD